MSKGKKIFRDFGFWDDRILNVRQFHGKTCALVTPKALLQQMLNKWLLYTFYQPSMVDQPVISSFG